MSVQRGLVKLGPLATLENLRDLSAPGRIFFPQVAMKLGPNASVNIDHDSDKVIGRILSVFDHDDVDGRWMFAGVQIDKQPPWLRGGMGGTRASVSYVSLGESSIPGQACVRGLVTRLALLSPGVEPAEPRAHVTYLGPVGPASSPAAGLSSDRLAAGDVVFYGDGRELWDGHARREEIDVPRVLVRRYFDTPITVR